MTTEDPAVSIAKLDGRLLGMERQLSDISGRMATSEGTAAVQANVSRLEAENAAVKARLQVVEDRAEARKFQFSIAIAIGALGIVLNIAGDAIRGAIGG